MLLKLLTFVIPLTFFGCDSKEYKKEQNSNISTVADLNKRDSSSVISKLSAQEDLTPRERYYLASAYSQKGGVDVFSLYSVLEMQLFRKNALEWSDLSKEKNPYLKFMKGQEGIDFEKRLKKREERWNSYLPKILEKHNLNVKKKTLEEVQEEAPLVTQEELDFMNETFEKKYKEILELPLDMQLRMNEWGEYLNEIFTKREIKYAYTVVNTYTDMIQLETMKKSYLYPEEKATGSFGSVRWEMLYMNILWNTYEAIPLMKQLPTLSSTQQEYVTEALLQYKFLLKDPEFRTVALKNITVLAGVSLLSIYKESFDLEEINSIQDLMCSFEPEPLIDNYGLVRKRVFFLAEMVRDSDLVGEDLKQYKSQVEEFKAGFPEELEEENKANYLQGVEKFKLDSCFNG